MADILAAQALDDQLLAVLRDAQGFPLSTRQVCEAAGPMAWPPDYITWKRLDTLAKAGRVERVKLAGWRQVWWRVSGTVGDG
ncbi:MAG TPA: hypothetical protein VG276_28145 [Actinomycetes bacterium]|jgi:hypothetical protein|nr:hypothetical protein [Actinomycetes bacterium]